MEMTRFARAAMSGSWVTTMMVFPCSCSRSKRFMISALVTAEECVAIAQRAEPLAAADLQRRALDRAIALDRDCQPALLMLAALSMDDGEPSLTFALLEETARAGLLPDDVGPLHRELLDRACGDPRLENYLRAIGRVGTGRAETALSIVLVTNLFPPQELGGYGRMMWEFAHGLMARGHTVKILTSDETGFGKSPTDDESAMEAHVSRTLKLAGTWVGGRAVPINDRAETSGGCGTMPRACGPR